MALTSATANRPPRSDDGQAGKERNNRIGFRREPACASAGTEAGHCVSPVATPSGRSRFKHGKANSDRIMGRPADPEKNHEPGQRHGWDDGGKKTKDLRSGSDAGGLPPAPPPRVADPWNP